MFFHNRKHFDLIENKKCKKHRKKICRKIVENEENRPS